VCKFESYCLISSLPDDDRVKSKHAGQKNTCVSLTHLSMSTCRWYCRTPVTLFHCATPSLLSSPSRSVSTTTWPRLNFTFTQHSGFTWELALLWAANWLHNIKQLVISSLNIAGVLWSLYTLNSQMRPGSTEATRRKEKGGGLFSLRTLIL